MGWTTDESSFDSRWGQEMFLFPIQSTAVLDPTQPSSQWELGKRGGRRRFPGLKWSEGNHRHVVPW